MSDLVIETAGLRKVYGAVGRRTVAVDDLDLTVERGGVHGFLGPNGSGKTTTIRMLVGLARPSGGSIRLLDQPLPERLPLALEGVGAVVDAPQFSPGLSVRRNLQLLARSGHVERARVDEVLERVDLRDRARTRYRRLSLGMKQRLAIAAALLKSPELLILDEPTNGLDPAGISDMRRLVRELGDSGTTVLLSSHNLAEVQQVCRSVSIIADGRLLASGPVRQLLGENVARTRVGVADLHSAALHLRDAGYTVVRDAEVLVVEGHEHPDAIARLLAEHGLFVSELSAMRPDLETFFLQLTGHDLSAQLAHERGEGR
ncbi:MAG TPA: ABC transporter ATP-binding protein [Marmoricola sp.]|jgi:ABC-2 type transport system ATP-binding protein|nr:ABC transporter ATP-binding protein [Marmoricola sp.]